MARTMEILNLLGNKNELFKSMTCG